jgi:hypothetical protein
MSSPEESFSFSSLLTPHSSLFSFTLDLSLATKKRGAFVFAD